MRSGPPWSLVVWLGLCAALMLVAPEPPQAPPASAQERAIRQRNVDMVVRDTKRWQAEHGDRTLPWARARGHLAIVIDDVGRELHVFEQLLALRYPLTFSVLPGSIYAAGVQLRLRGDRRRHREIMLHLPMEPASAHLMHEGAEASEDFLRLTDDPVALRAKVAAAFSAVPAAVGVNNHMGSALTRDAAAMREVMSMLRDRGLFFVDSRTIGDTRAEEFARAAGLPTLRREVFLDHDPSAEAIEAALDEAARSSRSHPVVAIAHPSAEVVEVLARRLPQLLAEGVAVYPVSRLVAVASAAQGQTERPATQVGLRGPLPSHQGEANPRPGPS